MDISPAMRHPDDDPPLNVEVVPDEVEVEDDYIEEEEPQEDPAADHYVNMAELINKDDLTKIATDLIELVDNDERSRSDWIEAYRAGLDYLGFKGEARKQPFEGSCGVYHPVMTEAVVRFQSNAIMEIFPAVGPVLTKVIGDETPDRYAQSKRVRAELNYQLTEKMREYRNETEQLLFRLPLAGSVFRKVYYDPIKKRPSACMVPAEDFIIDYGCSDIENSERYTHVMRKSHNHVRRLQVSGFYRDIKLAKPEHTPPKEGKEKENEIVGIDPSPINDDRHVLYEVHTYLDLPDPFNDKDGIANPYIITIEKTSNKVLSIYRNWSPKETEYRCAEEYFVHYQYMPGLGFYGIGLIHLIGSIAKASTSILRQLVDAGTLSNLPGGLKTRGLRTKGDETPIKPGEWRDVDVPPGTIAQNLFPMPYKEPSMVLVQLLQALIEEGRRVGSIADFEISAQSMNAPVGTTLALLERSLKVMSAVHARLHASLKREFGLIGKTISQYMDEFYEWDLERQFNRKQDFDERVDIIPVSDPSSSTQAQKIIKQQAVQQQVQMNPELYNLREVHRAGLQAIGIENDERILPLDKPPPRMDPVQENMAILTSRPIKVFQDQDHSAHIQVHLSLSTDPKILEMLKVSPNAPKIQGAMEAHMAEHLAYQYHAEMQQMMGVTLPPLGEEQPPQVENILSRALADASVRLRELHEQEAQEKQAKEIAADPLFQLREREIVVKERSQAAKEKLDENKLVVDIVDKASRERVDYARMDSDEAQTAANVGANLVTFGATLESEERREALGLAKEMANTIDENMKNARAEARETQKMTEESNEAFRERAHDHMERERDRQVKLQAAKKKAPTT